MCGIFGLYLAPAGDLNSKDLLSITKLAYKTSERRGKEASGMSLMSRGSLANLKEPIRGSDFIKLSSVKDLIKAVIQPQYVSNKPNCVIGHTRMVTNGDPMDPRNNQPVSNSQLSIIHNGIITNEQFLNLKHTDISRECEVDSELILLLLEKYTENGFVFRNAAVEVSQELEGANNFAALNLQTQSLLLSTSNGSIYYALSGQTREFIFASEAHILSKLMKHRKLRKKFMFSTITQLAPRSLVVIETKDSDLLLSTDYFAPRVLRQVEQNIINPPIANSEENIGPMSLDIDFELIDKLRRCLRCVLPETIPHINFDSQGICNFCRIVETKKSNLISDLIHELKDSAGVLVPISGGRDSCYALHYLVTELGLNVTAYTYDWGMVTDLARRNISRMCGDLGVEHILISADIQKKRSNVARNILAWLKKPNLGTLPLFMAGDKMYFYFAQLLCRQLNLSHVIFAMNEFEKTNFKTGFAGIKPNYTKKSYDLYFVSKLRLFLFYILEAVKNPNLLNSSVADSFFGYISYYFIPKKFVSLYDYVDWDETEINYTLKNLYGWEKATDAETTWRVGDGTSAFYNYIYLCVAGFTENDALRSNLIRAGKMTRKQALLHLNSENFPRPKALDWYFKALNLNSDEILTAINQIPKRY